MTRWVTAEGQAYKMAEAAMEGRLPRWFLHQAPDRPADALVRAMGRHRTAGAGSGSSRTPLIHPAPFRAPRILLVVIGRRSASASTSRSASVRPGRTSASISCSRKSASYRPRPTPFSHWPMSMSAPPPPGGRYHRRVGEWSRGSRPCGGGDVTGESCRAPAPLSRGPGNGILRAETGGLFQAQNAREPVEAHAVAVARHPWGICAARASSTSFRPRHSDRR